MRWGRGRILAVANASITSKRLQGPNNYSSVGRPTVLVGGALTTDEQGGCDEGCSARACELVHCHVGYGDDQGAKHSAELHRGGGQGGVRQCEA